MFITAGICGVSESHRTDGFVLVSMFSRAGIRKRMVISPHTFQARHNLGTLINDQQCPGTGGLDGMLSEVFRLDLVSLSCRRKKPQGHISNIKAWPCGRSDQSERCVLFGRNDSKSRFDRVGRPKSRFKGAIKATDLVCTSFGACGASETLALPLPAPRYDAVANA